MSEHLDGELPPAGEARMKRHLGQCHECRRLLADLRRILEGLDNLRPPGEAVDVTRIATSVRARLSRPA